MSGLLREPPYCELHLEEWGGGGKGGGKVGIMQGRLWTVVDGRRASMRDIGDIIDGLLYFALTMMRMEVFLAVKFINDPRYFHGVI